MKKLGITLILIIISINLVLAEIRINEVELNPEGSDAGKEWVEIYSSDTINLNGWKVLNGDNQEYLLNQTFSGYKVIYFNKQFLDNENESIRVYNRDELIYTTPIFKDNFNDDKTWSYCDNHWSLLSSTPGAANNCLGNASIIPPSNQTTSYSRNITVPYKYQLTLGLDWNDEDIIYGKEFEVSIKALNLENKKYDIKVYLYSNSKSKPITETYDSDRGWLNSKEYLDEFFIGPGNISEDVKIRIADKYNNLSGKNKIGIRIRESESLKYIDEIEEEIEILKSDIKIKQTDLEESMPISSYAVSDYEIKEADKQETIKIGKTKTQAIKTNKITIYKSKDEIIITYSIYAFVVLCVLFMVLLFLKKAI